MYTQTQVTEMETCVVVFYEHCHFRNIYLGTCNFDHIFRVIHVAHEL